MSGEDADEDKQYEPSQKRLDEARKRGEIPKSNDLLTAASYAGLLLAAVTFGAQALVSFGETAKVLLDQPVRMADLIFADARAPIWGMITAFSMAVAPLLLLPVIGVLAALFAQRALHFAPEKLAFKASRISPIANAKQKFGPDGLFEFAKSFAKMGVVGLILALALLRHGDDLLQSMHQDPAQATVLMLDLMLEFLFVVMLALLGFGGIDYLWQRYQHNQRNRMSRKEMMDEMKDAEGDPHVKQQRRQRGQEIASNQMLQDVSLANVVIVNPTHYAVALKWDRKSQSAPICVAKGVDEIAAKIRERAAEAGVPLHSDPPTARAIFASVEIGQQIRAEHFRAVAAAIRFSEAMAKRRKGFMARGGNDHAG